MCVATLYKIEIIYIYKIEMYKKEISSVQLRAVRAGCREQSSASKTRETANRCLPALSSLESRAHCAYLAYFAFFSATLAVRPGEYFCKVQCGKREGELVRARASGWGQVRRAGCCAACVALINAFCSFNTCHF